MIKDEFSMHADAAKLLAEEDPTPYTTVRGDSIFLLAGPHNGRKVPQALHQSLGTEPEWFNGAHEAYDLHVSELFERMQQRFDNLNYIYGNYSRLVVDLNRMPDYSITETSSEHEDFKIPHNQLDKCDLKSRNRRISEIYAPYHEAKHNLINDIRSQKGGVIVIDMHSFTPTWQQRKRDVEIGTIRCEKTPLSQAAEDFLRQQEDYNFVSGEPYRVANRPASAAPLISRSNDLQYFGIEIRNDLIGTPEGMEKMTAFLGRCIEHIKGHENFEKIIQPRHSVMDYELPEPQINPAYMI